jgi:prepilin-type N-terminal cleavage/methylation domain-containing protein
MPILQESARRGLTLVELLVVMMIILILATIVVAFAPGFQDSQKVARGADQVQGWLLMGRQWAKKDRTPTGIRLLINNGVATDLLYIQTPPSFTVPFGVPGLSPTQQAATPQPLFRKISVQTNAAGTTTTVSLDLTAAVQPFQNVGDFAGGQFNSGDSTKWAVQPGDSLVIHGTICLVGSVSATNPVSNIADQITLSTPLTGNLLNIPATTDYYFVRGARALSGESTLKLPQDVAVDTSKGIPSTTGTGQLDILFSPSGELLSPSTSTVGKVILWVRDTSKLDSKTSDETLIAIDIRTGLIAAQPVGPASDPFVYTRDGRPSGL